MYACHGGYVDIVHALVMKKANEQLCDLQHVDLTVSSLRQVAT